MMLAAALTLAPGAAFSEETGSGASVTSGSSSVSSSGSSGWLLSGGPLGIGSNAFLGEVGWPGLDLSLVHGQSERRDLGGTFAFVYGLEGVPVIAPGLRLNAIVRLNLVDNGRYNIGLRTQPGFVTYFPSSGTYTGKFCTLSGGNAVNCYTHSSYVTFGLTFPIEAVVGINVHPLFSLNIGLSLPMTLLFVPDVSFVMPIEPGFGIEYKVDSNLSVTFDARFGPSIFIIRGGSDAWFAFRTLAGVAYKF